MANKRRRNGFDEIPIRCSVILRHRSQDEESGKPQKTSRETERNRATLDQAACKTKTGPLSIPKSAGTNEVVRGCQERCSVRVQTVERPLEEPGPLWMI